MCRLSKASQRKRFDGNGLALIEAADDARAPWLAQDISEANAIRGFSGARFNRRRTGYTFCQDCLGKEPAVTFWINQIKPHMFAHLPKGEKPGDVAATREVRITCDS